MDRLNIVWNAADGEVATRNKLEDRLLLFSLVYGLKPQKCLDIGTYKGGSAQVIVTALDECEEGSVISIDPNPQVNEEVWNSIKHRCTIIVGHSPQDIPEETFDFVFIDGNHNDVYSDLKALYPKLNTGAYILCHDCYYHNVAKGIERILRETDLIDCGILSKKTFEARGHKFLGSRLLRTAT
jgi:predicted O-methyltransferase YrrM